MFNAFKAAEKPTHVQFASGRTEPIPDVTSLMQPSTLGDIMTYTLFSAGGIFIFGELGGLAGSAAAASSINSDPESRKRIETAWKRFRADVLRQQIAELDKDADGGLPGLVW